MARPRVFVSSTFYDLRHIRASLETFIESLGFEPVLFERGHVSYAHHVPLDVSCYHEIESADIFVLIVGSSYGSAASEQNQKQRKSRESEEDFDSITKKEFERAIDRDIPAFILVESAVRTEYETYKKNVGKDVTYVHAAKQVYQFLDGIFSLNRNNPIFSFERFSDIESWLREQWAGRFRDLLRDKSEKEQLKTLSNTVASLQDVTQSLNVYLQKIVEEIIPKNSREIIQQETKRLVDSQLRRNPFMLYLENMCGDHFEVLKNALVKSESVDDFTDDILVNFGSDVAHSVWTTLHDHKSARTHLNQARELVGAEPFQVDKFGEMEEEQDDDTEVSTTALVDPSPQSRKKKS